MNPAQELRPLMAQRKLTRPAVAALASVSKVTVDSWLAPPEAKLYIASVGVIRKGAEFLALRFF
jgi:hypothetical protein